MLNYIYLLKLREFVKTNENIYKIGMTTQNNFKRFRQYPKGSILLYQTICSDCKNIETQLIKKFKSSFIQRKDIGNEYFEGDYKSMIKMIYIEIENEKDEVNNTMTNNIEIKINNNIKNIEKCNTKIEELENKFVKIKEINTINNKSTNNSKNNSKNSSTNMIDIINNTISRKNSKYSCKNCNKRFTTKRRSETHVEKGACSVNVKCDICKLSFKMQGGLNRHIEKMHPIILEHPELTENTLPCKNEIFTDTLINITENKLNDLSCKYCKKNFTRKDNLKKTPTNLL
jgi:hypothetical protein